MYNILTIGNDAYASFIGIEFISLGITYNINSINEGFYPDEKTFENMNLVIFTGGYDVHPSLYGHKVHATTDTWMDRDREERKIYKTCLVKKIPMLGICRGSQFLWVMSGGKLFQNVEKHGGKHMCLDLTSQRSYKINSTHHQMADISSKPDKIDVLAISEPTLSKTHIRYNPVTDSFEDVNETLEVEAWVNPTRNILGVQWHPEAMSCPIEGRNLALTYIKRLLNV